MRLLGPTDEERLEIEKETGIKTDGVMLLLEHARRQAQELSSQIVKEAIKEVQSVVGPHGSVTRLQAGGVNISQGLGVSVYESGVLKTTIEPDGDFLAGSDITQPADTSFCVFVNEQVYNNEQMGAGDLLIGDNSTGQSNVKFDASEGQLQFRYGTTVNVYMDTDGSLKAGGGAVVLDEDGMNVQDVGDAIILKDLANKRYGVISMRDITNGPSGLSLLVYQVSSETNQISNGDFETGDFTNWTETDPSSKLSVEATDLGYSLKFGNSASSTGYVQQNLASSSTTGAIVTLRVKAESGGSIGVGTSSAQQVYGLSALAGWRTVTIVLNGTVNELRVYGVTGASAVIYVDEIVIRKTSANQEESFVLGPTNSYLNGFFAIGGVADFNPADISGTTRFASGFKATAGLHVKGIASATLSGTYNDYLNSSIEDVSILRLTASAGVAFTGLRYSDTISGAGSSYTGKVVTIINVGSSNTITLNDENTGSTAEWRFALGGGNLIIPPKGAVSLWYDGTSERWRVLSHNQLVGSVAETNAEDVFRCDNPGGASLWTGTITGGISGSTLNISTSTGQNTVLKPFSTSQLAKMRIYNTTRGNSALIQDFNTATNQMTLTATVPANWANGDSLTIASQTVSGGGFNWIDLEVVSGPTSKQSLFLAARITPGAAGDALRVHPLETFGSGKVQAITGQVAGVISNGFVLVKVTTNVFSISWTGTPTDVFVREAGYLS